MEWVGHFSYLEWAFCDSFGAFPHVLACSRARSGSLQTCFGGWWVFKGSFGAFLKEVIVFSVSIHVVAFNGGGLALWFWCGVLVVSCNLYSLLCALRDPLFPFGFSGFRKQSSGRSRKCAVVLLVSRSSCTVPLSFGLGFLLLLPPIFLVPSLLWCALL